MRWKVEGKDNSDVDILSRWAHCMNTREADMGNKKERKFQKVWELKQLVQ